MGVIPMPDGVESPSTRDSARGERLTSALLVAQRDACDNANRR